MQSSSFHTLPPFFLLLAAIFAVVVAVLQIGILGYAYERIGISRRAAYTILFLSLVGSYVNIPIAEIHPISKAPGKRPLGLAKGKATILPSFFDPLPANILDAFEGKESERTLR